MATAGQLKSITMLFTAYGQGGESERIAMYVEMLADIPAEVLDKVCKKAMYENKYLPSIAELVQNANNLIAEISGTDIPSWDEAWKEIEKEMNDTFVYGKPRFSSAVIQKAVDSFGWEELCTVETKNLFIARAQLRDMYLAICEQRRKSKVNNYVMGNGKLIGGSESCGKRLLTQNWKQTQ